jgi:hypothetical protein
MPKSISSHVVPRGRDQSKHAALDLLGKLEPTTPYVAKFSIPFCIATALRYGHVNLGDFSPTRLEGLETLFSLTTAESILERVTKSEGLVYVARLFH